MDNGSADLVISYNDGYFGVPEFVVGLADLGIGPNQAIKVAARSRILLEASFLKNLWVGLKI